ncbi:MAG: hypothetical protein FJ086_12065 [Deltaproteobacteria bacterium]|nr:hypothetical protein [Deltaproteobacteria bacterium]
MERGETRPRAALAAAWEAEVVSARRLQSRAERAPARDRARLLALAAYCRSHAARIVARLSTLGSCPLPVPPEGVALAPDPSCELRAQARCARRAAARYASLSEASRARSDVSSARVCELNRAEEVELAEALEGLGLAERGRPA